MYGETAIDESLSGIHRYFPEWADRPVGPDAQHESDRNSYLAGGYADEFGYGTALGYPPAIAPLDGDPESCRLWREQIGALHPGYPECPKPLDRYGSERPREMHAARSGRIPSRGAAAFRVIQVGLQAETRRSHTALRIGLISFIAERLIRSRRLNDVI